MEDQEPYGNFHFQFYIVYEFRRDPITPENRNAKARTFFTYEEARSFIPSNYQQTDWNKIKDNDYFLLVYINRPHGDRCELYTQKVNDLSSKDKVGKTVKQIAQIRAKLKGTSLSEELRNMKAELEEMLLKKNKDI